MGFYFCYLVSVIVEILEAGALVLIVISFVLLSRIEGGLSLPVCESGYYLNKTCTPCSVCSQGYGVQLDCEGSQDTVCIPCTDGQYSKLRSTNMFCTNCTDCAAFNKALISECTLEQDSVCGGCSLGHFLQISRDGSTLCAQCSQCPPGREAMRWFECSDLPENRQCAPGYKVETPAEPGVTTPQNPNVNQLANLVPMVSKLGSNRTVFLVIGTPAVVVTGQPVFEIIVSVVSLAFTLITVLVFGCAVCSFCIKACKH